MDPSEQRVADTPVSQNKNNGRWTPGEHRLFLQALEQYGKNWQLIANVVQTRDPYQVRSHSQKYFVKLEQDRLKIGSNKELLSSSQAEQIALRTRTGLGRHKQQSNKNNWATIMNTPIENERQEKSQPHLAVKMPHFVLPKQMIIQSISPVQDDPVLQQEMVLSDESLTLPQIIPTDIPATSQLLPLPLQRQRRLGHRRIQNQRNNRATQQPNKIRCFTSFSYFVEHLYPELVSQPNEQTSASCNSLPEESISIENSFGILPELNRSPLTTRESHGQVSDLLPHSKQSNFNIYTPNLESRLYSDLENQL